jgi:hypothetical protein
MAELCSSLSINTLKTTLEIATLASTIRGFGHIKASNAEKAGKQLALLSKMTEKA